MASSTFHGLFDIQPVSKVASPEPTYQKNNHRAPKSTRDIGVLPDVELEQFPSGNEYNHNSTRPKTPVEEVCSGTQTPTAPNDLELSRPPTPRRDDAVGSMPTWNSPPMTKWRIMCCCLIYFSNGMNDSGMSVLMGWCTAQSYTPSKD